MRRPKGVVFDVNSLKSPLRARAQRTRSHIAAGWRQLHPMFGPSTELLSGRHVIFVDAGSPDATAAARELFASTMVEQVVMSLDDHDRLVAVLGLSHALNIAFFTALAESGGRPRLASRSCRPPLSTPSSTWCIVGAGKPGACITRSRVSTDYGSESPRGAVSLAVERLRTAVISRTSSRLPRSCGVAADTWKTGGQSPSGVRRVSSRKSAATPEDELR